VSTVVVSTANVTESAVYDIVVVGGGMVGSMLAAALGHTDMSIAVLESRAPEPFDPHAIHDLRVSALSLASERMLAAVGAWHRIKAMRACPYTRMQVWDHEAGGETHFYSGDLGYTHLGHIVENRVLQLALKQCLERLERIDYLCPATLVSFRLSDDYVELVLSDNTKLKARLVVGADGANSKVRDLAGIGYETFAYPQNALVATIETLLPQQSTTWQRFLPTGPQAFLPLSGPHASMVWYHSPDEISRLKALPEHSFCAEMEAAFPACLGKIQALLGRGSFALMRSHAAQYVKPRVAIIGDAAHSVHPLAGQGVNLGLLDAAVLAEVIIQGRTKYNDVGDENHLRRYERWRRIENSVMITALDAFYHAFKPQPRPLRRIRSVVMNAANQIQPLKNLVAAYAMGVRGDLPELAKGKLPS